MEICAGADEEQDDHEKGLEFEDSEHLDESFSERCWCVVIAPSLQTSTLAVGCVLNDFFSDMCSVGWECGER